MIGQDISFQFLLLTAILVFWLYLRKPARDSWGLLVGDPQQYSLTPCKNPACYQFWPPQMLFSLGYKCRIHLVMIPVFICCTIPIMTYISHQKGPFRGQYVWLTSLPTPSTIALSLSAGEKTISLAERNTVVIPVDYPWSYRSLALSHQHDREFKHRNTLFEFLLHCDFNVYE